jgi:hypothetical protein
MVITGSNLSSKFAFSKQPVEKKISHNNYNS